MGNPIPPEGAVDGGPALGEVPIEPASPAAPEVPTEPKGGKI